MNTLLLPEVTFSPPDILMGTDPASLAAGS